MADPSVLEKAMARRARIVRELEKLPTYRELLGLDGFIATYRELAGEDQPVPEARALGRPAKNRKPTIPDIAAEICLAKGEPIPVGELVTMLAERGRPIGGGDPNINLSSVLSRDPGFGYVRGRGWYPNATRG